MPAKHTNTPAGQSGRDRFLAQCELLRSGLNKSRRDNTAKRFNRLDEGQRMAVFILANYAVTRFGQLPELGHEHVRSDYESLSDEERQTLLMGIKHLSELAALLPWEFTDFAAPRAELVFQREKEKKLQLQSEKENESQPQRDKESAIN